MKIIPEKLAEYGEYVDANSQDPYSAAVVKAGNVFMDALDAGGTPEEAEAKMMSIDEELGGMTGFMVSSMIAAVAHFHERGDEVKAWWNTKHGAPADAEGTVNTAIIDVDTDKI